MNRRALRSTLATCLLMSIAIPSLALADPGDMMHMSISGKVQVSNPPMSIAIPSINKDVCSPKQVDVRTLVTETSRNKNCTYSNYKQDGNTISFHYACNGDKQQLDGDGSFTIQSGGVHGTIHANSSMHGQATTVDMTYEGSRTGASCEYTPPKAAY
ncbi:MAG TPA: DUF3617 family protein [Xanthomonadaceae bacterium]|jgi:hypothetical protein|nr:DUF3617 family protein [Xanthomonadaceae bacterium]